MRPRTHLRKMTTWGLCPRSFERHGRFYRCVGVPIFKRLFMAAVGRKKSNLNYGLEGRGLTSLESFERWTRVYESCHLILGAMFAGIVVWLFLEGRDISPEFIISGWALNCYLVFLQRYNRVRLLRAITRLAT